MQTQNAEDAKVDESVQAFVDFFTKDTADKQKGFKQLAKVKSFAPHVNLRFATSPPDN